MTQSRALSVALPLPMLGRGSSTASSTVFELSRPLFCRITSSAVVRPHPPCKSMQCQEFYTHTHRQNYVCNYYKLPFLRETALALFGHVHTMASHMAYGETGATQDSRRERVGSDFDLRTHFCFCSGKILNFRFISSYEDRSTVDTGRGGASAIALAIERELIANAHAQSASSSRSAILFCLTRLADARLHARLAAEVTINNDMHQHERLHAIVGSNSTMSASGKSPPTYRSVHYASLPDEGTYSRTVNVRSSSTSASYRLQYRVYKWRWFMLLALCALNVSNGMVSTGM